MDIPRVIVCVDCGAKAHLVQEYPPDMPPRPGDILVYRCEECLDRWDIVLEADEPDPGDIGFGDTGFGTETN